MKAPTLVSPSPGPLIPPRLLEYFKDYASFHRTPGNQYCHYFGVPMIAITLFGLLGNLVIAGGLTGTDILRLDGGSLLWIVASVWYFTLDWKISIPFSLFSLGMYFVGRALPVPALWTFFVLGWIVQYVGHLGYEKKSPAFYKNLTHILIGPLWVFAKWIGYYR